MAQVYPYLYKGKVMTKQNFLKADMPLDKVRIWLDFNGFCGIDEKSQEVNLYLFAQGDIVNDSSGNDVELYDGMKVSVFDNDFDTLNRPDAILAEGVVIKNTLEQYPMIKWLIKLTENKKNYKSGNKYVYWMSDLH